MEASEARGNIMLQLFQPLTKDFTVDSFARGLELLHGKRRGGMFLTCVFPHHLLNNVMVGVIAETIWL